MGKPFFCVIEGIDGAGKGTQLWLLERRLKKEGMSVLATREPTQTLTGYFLKIVLKMGDIHPLTDCFLFAADRAEHVDKLILPALEKDTIVLCERYLFSSIAYQTMMGVDENLIRHIHGFALMPDLTFLLDVPPEVSMSRKEQVLHYEGEKFEEVEFLTRVREKYHELARLHHMVIVDGDRDEMEIHEDIYQAFAEHYKNKSVQTRIARFVDEDGSGAAAPRPPARPRPPRAGRR